MPEDRIDVATIDPGPDKVIGPGHDFGTVTDKIGGVVYQPFLQDAAADVHRVRVRLHPGERAAGCGDVAVLHAAWASGAS